MRLVTGMSLVALAAAHFMLFGTGDGIALTVDGGLVLTGLFMLATLAGSISLTERKALLG